MSSPPQGFSASGGEGYVSAEYDDPDGTEHLGYIPGSVTAVPGYSMAIGGGGGPSVVLLPVGTNDSSQAVPANQAGAGSSTTNNTPNILPGAAGPATLDPTGWGAAIWEALKRAGVVGLGIALILLALFFMFADAAIHEWKEA